MPVFIVVVMWSVYIGMGVLSAREARQRRRQMLTALAAAASVTAVVAFVFGGAALVALHLATDALLAGYVVVLIRTHRPADHRSTVVYLPRPVTTLMVEPAYLQRSAN
jgi:small neutral amino acid transporter SnatA (MarC family)